MASNQSSYPLERVVAAAREANPEAVVFFQLYHSTDRRVVQSFLRRAEEVGCAGVVLTVDTVQLGWRPRDLDLAHLPFLKGQGIAQYLTDPAFLGALDEPLEGPPFRPKPTLALLKNLLALRQTGKRYGLDLSRMQKAVRRFVATYSFPELSWEDVERVREATRLPLLLKGLLHPEDAVRRWTWGRTGSTSPTTGEGRWTGAWPPSRPSLPSPGRWGQGPRAHGQRRPHRADAVKALALGARAVGLGRSYAYGLALGGEEGVIPFYANAFVLGHQWNRVCRLRVSGSWARTRHRSATTSIISSRSRKYRLATASFTRGHTRSTGWSSGE
jgi:lactate 2-monooxygenase